MNILLPTLSSANWTATSLTESVLNALKYDKTADKLIICSYAVTSGGWNRLRKAISTWRSKSNNREVIAYVGTDHAITEPDALKTMLTDGIQVNIMLDYEGIYHPKVIWLSGQNEHAIWVGSNNITEAGLIHNIEFATLTKSSTTDQNFNNWLDEIRSASAPLDDKLLTSYENERRNYAKKLTHVGTFSWSQRAEPHDSNRKKNKKANLKRTNKNKLIIEIMPRETGQDGKQIQLPIDAASSFFFLRAGGSSSRTIIITPDGTSESRELTMTLYHNNTTRLSINELDYRHRPCLILFSHIRNNHYTFRIIQKSVFPKLYQDLLKKCANQTRRGSRRWAIYK